MQKVEEVSNKIWNAIKAVDTEVLEKYIHKEAMFIHMGVSLSRDEEIKTLKEGLIINKNIEFQDKTIKDFDNITILFNKLKVTAVVKGNEVTNTFVVTEVYTKENDGLKLASLSYTKINY